MKNGGIGLGLYSKMIFLTVSSASIWEWVTRFSIFQIRNWSTKIILSERCWGINIVGASVTVHTEGPGVLSIGPGLSQSISGMIPKETRIHTDTKRIVYDQSIYSAFWGKKKLTKKNLPSQHQPFLQSQNGVFCSPVQSPSTFLVHSLLDTNKSSNTEIDHD